MLIYERSTSADKERFFLKFSQKLGAKGIDAWLDKWEMYPGDSLIDKIFEEGIKNAQAIIIVLSNNSINKKWVREELNAGMVKKINEGSKLIPVIIDDCEIPECLKSTIWIRIKNLDNYNEELDRIVMSILGESDKPPLGPLPIYTKFVIDSLPGLTKLDTLVIKLSCEEAIKIGDPFIDVSYILEKIKSLDIPKDEILESIEVLGRKGYFKITKTNIGISHFTITIHGFDNYARNFIKDYDSIFNSLLSLIVNQNMRDNKSLTSNLKQPMMIVNHILYYLESRGFINISESLGGGVHIHIYNLSPELKRLLS